MVFRASLLDYRLVLLEMPVRFFSFSQTRCSRLWSAREDFCWYDSDVNFRRSFGSVWSDCGYCGCHCYHVHLQLSQWLSHVACLLEIPELICYGIEIPKLIS